MTNSLHSINHTHSSTQENKPPKMLKVLLVLSAIYIVLSLSTTVQALINGPLNEEQMEKESIAFREMIVELEENNISEKVIEMADVMLATTKYINDEAYYLSNTLRLFELIIGGVSLFLMYKLRKTGFHLYIIYSFFPIATTYIVLPMELILTASIIVSVILGAVFALLYGRNLKYME